MTQGTFPQLLRRNATGPNAAAIALRQKRYGIWRETSWSGYYERVLQTAAALETLGLAKGDRVAIIGGNREEWLFAEIGAQTLGAIAVGVYLECTTDEILHLCTLCEPTIVFAEDQEQVDKLRALAERTPSIRKIIYFEPKGLEGCPDPRVADLAQLWSDLGPLSAATRTRLEARITEGQLEDFALLAVTSGTTGGPKLAKITYGAMNASAQGMNHVDPKRPTDNYLSALPMPWMGEQMTVVGCHLLSHFAVNFPENLETVAGDLYEIEPNFMVGPPRYWQNLASEIRARIEDSTHFKRGMYRLGLWLGEAAVAQAETARSQGRTKPFSARLRAALAGLLVFSKLKDTLGYNQMRIPMTGGGSLSPDTIRLFHAMGIPLKQIYGQTETCGLSVMHVHDKITYETVGVPFPGTKLRILETGEILTQTPAAFSGYWKNDAATAETLIDGWVHSGDAGYIDGPTGDLVVVDRLKNMCALAAGDRFSPQFVEDKLKFLPSVQEAVVFGDGRPDLVALIAIDARFVGLWAEANRISFTTYRDLAANPRVLELIREGIRAVNAKLPREIHLRRFVLLPKELDADDGELTRTNKVRRSVIAEKYGPLIEQLYQPGRREAELDIHITYQTGRSKQLNTVLTIGETA